MFSLPRYTLPARGLPGAYQPSLAGDEGFRSVFACAPIGMALVGRDGRVLECNPRLCEMLGYDAGDLQGLTLADFALRDVVERDDALFRELLAGRSKPYEIEGRFRNRDGEEFRARLTTAPVHTEQGARALRMIEDLRERQRLEEQLPQLQRMATVGRLASGLAHDFNNLLTVIKGYADVLHGDLRDHPKWLQEADAISAAAHRAAGLTSQLLAFGRTRELKLQALNLNSIVGGVRDLLTRLMPSSIDFRVETGCDVAAVHADATQIEQVLVNLAVNARDAMPRGGVLRIQTANVELHDEHTARRVGVKVGSYVALTVTDTGVGMDEATRARIFEPFFTTKGQGRGLGLGLSTASAIVGHYGGSVCVQSEVGAGATFTVYLPVLAPAVVKAPQGIGAIRAAGESETVLLVEDQEAVRELLLLALERAGYQVIEAGNGQEALDAAQSHQGAITALVTDVVMPKLNGPDLYERLVKSRPGLKVVFMSGYTEDNVRPWSRDGETAFLEKPFSPTFLTKALRSLIDGQPQTLATA